MVVKIISNHDIPIIHLTTAFYSQFLLQIVKTALYPVSPLVTKCYSHQLFLLEYYPLQNKNGKLYDIERVVVFFTLKKFQMYSFLQNSMFSFRCFLLHQLLSLEFQQTLKLQEFILLCHKQ